jgi:hypothetical protein
MPGSNRRPSAWQADVLPTVLMPHYRKTSDKVYNLPKGRVIWYTVGESNPSYQRERLVS